MIPSAINILTSPLFSIVTLLLGFLIGNHLAIGRDRRKEFNAAADVMDGILTKERDILNPSSTIDFYAFRRVLNKSELSSFDKCLEKYEEAKKDAVINYSKPDGIITGGSAYYQDPTPIMAEINKLLKFTKRK
jgi:hypothetical protein